MNMIQSLSLRTTTALVRLSDLQRRAERVAQGQATLIRPALRELSAALEELQVANEHLQAQVDELVNAKSQLESNRRLLVDLQDALPLACLWTDEQGVVLAANTRASSLFNVARERLVGKPLLLFVSDRQALFDALATLRDPTATTLDLKLTIRPRERHARQAGIAVRRVPTDSRLCWFLSDGAPNDLPVMPPPVEEDPSAETSVV
jgi:nitrogen fixation/metabolism regulation signal transduction histidine kinase